MMFFVTLAWLFALRIADEDAGRYLWAGALAAPDRIKFSAAFILGVIAVAHLATPRRPRRRRTCAAGSRGPRAAEAARVVRAGVRHRQRCHSLLSEIPAGHPRSDRESAHGASKPIWIAQFSDVSRMLVTTNLWWGLGQPSNCGAFSASRGFSGAERGSQSSPLVPLIYFLTAGGTIAPMAVCLLRRRSPWRLER